MYREYTTYSQYTGGLKWKLPKMMTSFMNSPLLQHYLNWSFSILIIAHLYHNSCPSECSWPEWRRKDNEMKCKIKKRKIGSNTKYTKEEFFSMVESLILIKEPGRLLLPPPGWSGRGSGTFLWKKINIALDLSTFPRVRGYNIAKHPGVMQPLLRSRNLSLRHVNISSNQTNIFPRSSGFKIFLWAHTDMAFSNSRVNNITSFIPAKPWQGTIGNDMVWIKKFTSLAFGQEQHILDCHSPSLHIQGPLHPSSKPGHLLLVSV